MVSDMPYREVREPTFLLLAALAAGRRHGHVLLEEVAELSGGAVRLKPGTLYAALDRLVEEGAIAVDGEEVVAGRRRRYFVLTPAGAGVLAEHATRMRSTATVALRRLGLPGATA
jgi:PadR family transcriptional regulator, regulatory protein PadR